MNAAILTPLEIANWTALYLATGLCCAMAVVLAVVVTVFELRRERIWSSIDCVSATILFVPKTWWRWQKLYLTSMPMTLGIVGLFAASLRWS